MMTDHWFIREIDHRISTALVFFLLLMLLSNQKKKSLFPLRAAASLFVMCSVSWCLRTVIDLKFTGVMLQGVGYSVHLLAMILLFMGSYDLCYRSHPVETAYMSMLAMTLFKIAWNTFKVFAAAGSLWASKTYWTTYSPMGSLVSYAVYIAVCVFTCRFHQHAVKRIAFNKADRIMVVAFVLFMLCQLLLEFCGRAFTGTPSALFLYYFCALMYSTINYAVVLAITQLVHYRHDNEDMHNFIKNKMQYYEMSHEGITSLQIKCHDLKHQIATIRSKIGKDSFEKHIARLEDSINEYGTVVDCGNETLNIVLTEKNILCSANDVKFSYIIDGALFAFLSEMEIYSLFGNALDNALESCSRVSDPEKRVISLKTAARGDMVILHVENYFDRELKMAGDMPQTTKKGSGHGFGLRSIQQIAEKYDGVASVDTEGQIFKLTVCMKPPVD